MREKCQSCTAETQKKIGGVAGREGGSGREIEMAKESVDKVHDDAFKYFMP